MADIGFDNFIGSNNKNSQTRLLFLGRNETSKKIDLYAIPVVENSDFSTIQRRYLNIATEDNYVYANSGVIMGNMKSQQSAPEATFDFEASIDYNSQNSKAKAGIYTNLLEAVILGQGFYKGADFIRVIGTNGLLKGKGAPTRCDNKVEAYSFFAYEINNLSDGGMDGDTPTFKVNSFRKADFEVPSFAIETYELISVDNSSSTLIPYCTAPNASFSQADDTSKMMATVTRCCDAWDSKESLLTGAREYSETTDLNKTYFEVDYIVKGAVPTDFGASGDIIAVVNQTTGAFSIHTSTGSAWTANVVGGFNGYAKISANKVTASTIALAEDVRSYLVVTSVGAVNNAGFCVNSYDSTAVVTKDYVFETYVQDRIAQAFVKFAPTGNCY